MRSIATNPTLCNAQTFDGYALLHSAAAQGNLEVVKTLLKVATIDANVQDNAGHTPLGFASSGGHLDVVHLLLEQLGANGDAAALARAVNVIDVHGHGPLFGAVDRRKRDLIAPLMAAGANFEQIDENRCLPVLFLRCVLYNHKTTCRLVHQAYTSFLGKALRV